MTHDIIKKIAYRLSRSDILFWTLPFLMILLVVGTVAQKELGIYAAQKTYFASFITFIGPVPLPGGAALMTVLFVNMLMKFLLFSEWRWAKSGVILTHFGILVLLFGGFVTALTSAEGYLIVAQGASSSQIEDYYQRELVITKDGKTVFTLPHQDLKPGLIIADKNLPFTLAIQTYCFNCKIERRAAPDGFAGPGRFMRLSPDRTLPKNEENLTGIEFKIAGTQQDASYVTFDKFPKPPQFDIDGHIYSVEIRHAMRVLPFAVTLKKFTQTFYPGAETAKSYRSDVEVKDVVNWPATIEMNHPLRYKSYTLYQSSFDVTGEKPFTVLNVVKNSGRLFPYAASLLVTAGLILHIVLRLRFRKDV